MQQGHQRVVERVTTGIVGLDDILDGGLIPHRFYLVDGNPGAGKTTLALQYLLEGQRLGERGLYVTLSETEEELRASASSHGWSLDGFELIELVPDESNLDADAQYTMFHPAEVELPEIIQRVIHAVDESNPTRVVIDSISDLRLLAQNPLRFRKHLLALKRFFLGRNITILLLDDRSEQVTDVHVQSIAHGVISLELVTPQYGADRRRLRITKLRGSQYRGGYHDFCIRPGGLEIFPRLVAAEYQQPVLHAQTLSGVKALDTMLGGGLDRGTSTLLMGPAGAGKSTLAGHYAVAAAERGEHAALFLFDESIGTFCTRFASLGLDLQPYLEDGRLSIQQIDPAELSPGEFVQVVRHAIEQREARVVVLDSLNGYLQAMPEERFLLIQLHELLSYLGHQGVTTLLVMAQHGLVGSQMQTPVDVSYLADTLILLRYFEVNGTINRAVSVLKKRSGAHDGSIRKLWMNAAGVHVGPPLQGFHGVLTGVPTVLEGGTLKQTDSHDDA